MSIAVTAGTPGLLVVAALGASAVAWAAVVDTPQPQPRVSEPIETSTAITVRDRRHDLLCAVVVTVTKTEITYQGQLIATTESVLRGEDSPLPTIDALYERLDASAHKIMGGVRETTCERLVILEADPQADARWIDRVLYTARAADYDVVLAVRLGSGGMLHV